MKSPKIEKPDICRAFCCKGSSFAQTAVACFFGAAAWPRGMNDVKLVSFGQKLVWPTRRTGAKIRALIERRRRWRQFLLAGKGPAHHSLKVRADITEGRGFGGEGRSFPAIAGLG
jgi:hypothetical protein